MEKITYPNQDFYFTGSEGMQILQVTEGINDTKQPPHSKRGKRRYMAKIEAYRQKVVNTLKSSGMKATAGTLVKRR